MIAQYILIAIVVLAAVYWLTKRMLPRKKGSKSNCPGCSACEQIQVPED